MCSKNTHGDLTCMLHEEIYLHVTRMYDVCNFFKSVTEKQESSMRIIGKS